MTLPHFHIAIFNYELTMLQIGVTAVFIKIQIVTLIFYTVLKHKHKKTASEEAVQITFFIPLQIINYLTVTDVIWGLTPSYQ